MIGELPPAEKKVYPICTIRSTPDKPVHCIVWAKELFKLLFGTASESMLYSAVESERLDEAAEGADEEDAKVKSIIMETCRQRPAQDGLDAYARAVFDAVFATEIELKLQMKKDVYKGAKRPPKPIPIASAEADDETPASSSSSATTMLADQRVWSLKECAAKFVDSIKAVWMDDERRRLCERGETVFEKDDDVHLDFVTAAAHVRAVIFGIEPQSRFAAKGIAGNIIHAIATTNAIVSGIQVIETIKLLAQKLGDKASAVGSPDSKTVWVTRRPVGRGKCYLQPSRPQAPNKACYSCGKATMFLTVDTTLFTVGDFVDKILRGRLGMHEPSVAVGDACIFESGEGLEEDEVADYAQNAAKVFASAPGGGITEGTFINAEDFLQDVAVKFIVGHRAKADFDEEKHPQFFILGTRRRLPALLSPMR